MLIFEEDQAISKDIDKTFPVNYFQMFPINAIFMWHMTAISFKRSLEFGQLILVGNGFCCKSLYREAIRIGFLERGSLLKSLCKPNINGFNNNDTFDYSLLLKLGYRNLKCPRILANHLQAKFSCREAVGSFLVALYDLWHYVSMKRRVFHSSHVFSNPTVDDRTLFSDLLTVALFGIPISHCLFSFQGKPFSWHQRSFEASEWHYWGDTWPVVIHDASDSSEVPLRITPVTIWSWRGNRGSRWVSSFICVRVSISHPFWCEIS